MWGEGQGPEHRLEACATGPPPKNTQTLMSQIAGNLAEVRRRIEAAARRVGREPGGVRLVAVSKTVPLERLKEAVLAGHRLFGENYLQEAREKITALGASLSWHLVGHLQTKKAKAAVDLFDLIHAVDRLKLARALEEAAQRQGKIQDILLQVKLAEEETKSGAAPEEVPALLQEIGRMPHL
ncbi:MAG: YggS family pyridoxal phosphate enzyme, partial [Deltaproteobacteria bacterium RBG_13_58_19]